MIAALRRWIRGLYDWTMKWADTPYSLTALFLIALAESSFFPIPPDVLLIAIVASNTRRWLLAALLCSAGSVVGAMLGYYIGASLFELVGRPLVDFYHADAAWQYVVGKYNSDAGLVFLLGAAFTPIPFKVATIAAGATGIAFWPFVGVSMVGRAARFFLVAILLRVYGAPIRAAIEKHFDAFALAFLALFIAGFAAIKFL